MARFLVWIVARRVVATDEGPARLIAAILSRRVQQVAMEEDRRSWLQLDMDQLQALEGDLDALHVGPGLVAHLQVIDPPEVMRSLEHLQTTVLLGGAVHGDHTACQK